MSVRLTGIQSSCWALLIASLLALSGCNSKAGNPELTSLSGGNLTDPPVARVATMGPTGPIGSQPIGRHLAALGPLSGASVVVKAVDEPEKIIAEATTDGNGLFRLLYLASAQKYDNRMLLVTVTGGQDTDADDDGVRDAVPTPNKGQLNLLVMGADLRNKSVSVNLLGDVIYRTSFAYMDSVPLDAMLATLDGIAGAILKSDIDGDGVLGYSDILAFNPTRADDKTKLEINYADVFIKTDDDAQALPADRDTKPAMSLVDRYHAADEAGISKAIGDVFRGLLNVNLPDPEKINREFVSITINSNAGGTVTSPDVVGMRLGASNRQRVLKLEKALDPQPVRLYAEALAGYKFSRWVGCPDNGLQADGSCVVNPATVPGDVMVTAQFMIAVNKLKAGLTKEVALPRAPGKFGVTLTGFSATQPGSEGMMLLTANEDGDANDAQYRGLMQGIGVNTLVDTGVYNRALVKVLEVVEAPRTVANRFHQAKYRVQEVNIFEAYDAFGAEAPDRPVVMDDLLSVGYQEMVDEVNRNIVLSTGNQIGKLYTEGPTPSGQIDEQGGCPVATDEEIFTTRVTGAGETIIACIEQGAQPVESINDCEINETTLEIIDGRLYCVPQEDVVNNRHHSSGQFAFQQRPEALLVKVRNGGVGQLQYMGRSHKMQSLLPEAKKAKAEGRLTAKATAKEIFLAGYGRSFDMGDGIYLTNAPDGSGLAVIETRGKPQPVTRKAEKLSLYEHTCRMNSFASGCSSGSGVWYAMANSNGGGLVRTQGGTNLFQQPQKFELSSSTFFKVEVTVQMNLDVRASSSFNYAIFSFSPFVEFNSNGFLKVTPTLGLNLSVFAGKSWDATGKPASSDKAGPSQKLAKRVISFDFAQLAGAAGAAFNGEFEGTIGIEVAGTITISNEVKAPMAVRWDGVIGVGIGSDRNKFDFKGQPELKFAYVGKIEANAVVEPFVEAAVVTGARWAAPKLVKIAVRGFLQGEFLVESPTVKITNIPEELAKQENKTVCVDGSGGASFNAYYGVRAYLEVSTKDQPIDNIKTYTYTTTFGEWKWKFASYGWTFTRDEETKKFANPGNGFKFPEIKESPPCSGGLITKEASKNFDPGSLTLTDEAFVATNTRNLVMQTDGNLVLYNYDGDKGEKKGAVFATGTNGTFNVRMVYQSDGNLVLYNLRDKAIWASGTHRFPNGELRLQEDGQLLMWKGKGDLSATNYPVWGPSISQRPGNFELRAGEYIVTPNSTLYMQRDGNLVLYRFIPSENKDTDALWSTRTNGNANAFVRFQSDGNFVVYTSDGNRALWASNTGNRGATRLDLQRDGNLVIYDTSNSPLWASNTGGR